MIIYPAMDLMGGQVVRLRQGRFDENTRYPIDPRSALRSFAEAGADWAHVVDLDGARAGEPVQHKLIAKLAATTSLQLQVGGGIRSTDHVRRLLNANVARVAVGSVAVRKPQLVIDWLDRFGPDRIVLATDVRVVAQEPKVAVSGWTRDSGLTLWEVVDRFPAARHMLLTDIGRDGELAGPNFALLDEVVGRLPHLQVQASGGISSLADITRLRTAGAIVGKALWEGLFPLEEALDSALT